MQYFSRVYVCVCGTYDKWRYTLVGCDDIVGAIVVNDTQNYTVWYGQPPSRGQIQCFSGAGCT